MAITLPLKKRKIIHILLFLSILLIQILVYKTWNKEEFAQNNLSKEIKNSIKPNKALEFNNLAIKHYFEAGNYFNEYLQKSNKKDYLSYQEALKKMVSYLDSLDLLSKSDEPFKLIIKSKQKTENDIIILRRELDSLISIGINLPDQHRMVNFHIKKIDYDKVLSSISYDTLQKATSSKQKRLFGRIKDAFSNESNLSSLFTEVQIKIIYNNEPKTGNFEEQLKNVFEFSKNYYGKQILRIGKVYGNLKEKNDFLLTINQEILNKSQEILFFYSKSTQESTKKSYGTALELYHKDVSNRKRTLFYLFFAMILVTILLFLYAIYAYIYEKQLEKAKVDAERNLDIKNRLIGMLSHEMRVPLSVISNFSNKLKLENTDLSIASIINSIHFVSNSLKITVNQILDFFKNENSKLQLYNSKINLKQEVSSVLESLKSIAETKDIVIVSELDPSLDTLVWADVVKMHQLFYNFIGNSIKFTKEGSITVTAKLTKVENSLRFDVKISDTGLGIPKEEIALIFDRFYQSKTHGEQMGFGAGLGLGLCKEIIELFKGEISITSELNKGTEVSFYLLLKESLLDQETNQSKLIAKFKEKGLKVGAIDDDPLQLRILKKILKTIHFKASFFESPILFEEYLNNEEVDLIITDYQIANYSGIKLAENIKKIKNKNSKCPIILLSGDSYVQSLGSKLKDIDLVILKPINKEEFYFQLLKVLSKKDS